MPPDASPFHAPGDVEDASGDASASQNGSEAGISTTLDAEAEAAAVAEAAAPAPAYDGTSGKSCSSDSDCVTATGPGVNVCSGDFLTTVAGVSGLPLPAGVCLVPPTMANCDPAPPEDPNGLLPHFCDGPDAPSSPGLCIAIDPTAPVQGQGTCAPKCTFVPDGSPPVGCLAPDTCTLSTFGTLGAGRSATLVGYGFCQGTCQTGRDSPGARRRRRVLVPGRRRSLHDAARAAHEGARRSLHRRRLPERDLQLLLRLDDARGLLFDGLRRRRHGVPLGMVCDANEPTVVAAGSSVFGILTATPGLAGMCLPVCSASAGGTVSVDAGASDAGGEGGSDASAEDAGEGGAAPPASCPAGSSCTTGTLAGPDCVP